MVPKKNMNAKTYNQFVSLDNLNFEQPQAVRHLYDATAEKIRAQQLVQLYPSHNQRAAFHMKLVTEAAALVVGLDQCFPNIFVCWHSKRNKFRGTTAT